MRLSPEERLALKAHFLRELGADCDVLLLDPGTLIEPVHTAALATGVAL